MLIAVHSCLLRLILPCYVLVLTWCAPCGRNTGTEESKGGGIRSEESKADTPSVLAPVRGARRGITSSGMGGDDADYEDGRAPV
jgi:hypothetical protein